MGIIRSAAAAALSSVLCALPAASQVRTDGSLGRAPQSLTGPQFTIPETLGSLRGANLFHSFSVFGIHAGESATFTTATPGIANVISRVTGGEPSVINGMLRLAAAEGTPGFFFINPAGVTFGAGASIDVPGAFHVSTADYVKFSDGRYYSDASANSTLSSASPEAFGFLGAHRTAVAVNGGARLTAALMQPFSIVAGDVTLESATVQARGGEIRIVAVGGAPLEVPFTGALPAASGLLEVLDGGRITAPVEGARNGGTVNVSAGDIHIDGPEHSTTGIFSQANTGTTGNAGTLAVAASGELRVLGGGLISSSTFAAGDAGRISISAGSMAIAAFGLNSPSGVFSSADAGSSGNAGSIDVAVRQSLVMLDGGTISTGTFSAGRAGEIHVAAGDILISGRSTITTGIASQAQSGSTGPAGSVTVDATTSLFVEGRGQITASTFGSGRGGEVTVRAAEITLFDGGKIVSSASGAGDAGSVNVEGERITVDGNFGDSTAIVSNAQGGTGNAGSVRVVAHDSLNLLAGGSVLSNTFTRGNAGPIHVTAGDVIIDNRASDGGTTSISSNSYGTVGNSGAVTLDVARSLVLLDGGEISSSTFSAGNATSVTIRAGSIFMDAKEYTTFSTGIFSVSETGSGHAGSVDIVTSGDIVMLNGAAILSSTKTAGAAGSVRISAANLLVDGAGNYSSISSNSNPSASGDAGSVDVEVTGAITLRDGGFIGSSTFSSGNAGSVRVRARDITLSDGSISSQANESTGHAGSVDVAATGQLVVTADGTITSGTFSAGNAGSVQVRARDIALSDGGSISSQANDGTGHAGTVDVDASGTMVITGNAAISSSTFTAGNAGRVKVNAAHLIIDGSSGDSTLATGILSSAYDGTGNAGSVDVTAGRIEVLQGGEISSNTFARGNAGSVHVAAGDLTMDGRGSASVFTGIASNATRSSTGNAGRIEVDVERLITMVSGGEISSSTFSSGDAGSVAVRAGHMLIDGRGACPPCTGVFSQSEVGATGRAGEIDLTVAGSLTMLSNGLINTGTRNAHDAGRIRVSADTIVIDAQRSQVDVTGIVSNAIGGTGSGGVVDVSARSITLRDGATIASNTYAEGNAGTVRVSANDIVLDGRDTTIASHAFVGSAGSAGTVDVKVAAGLDILNGAQISTTSNGEGNAGAVSVAAGSIRLDGGEFSRLTGIVSETDFTFGAESNAGSVNVVASGDITFARSGLVSSTSNSFGSAGSVRVEAANIDLQGIDFIAGGIISRGGLYSSSAGTVEVVASGTVRVANGSQISSSAESFFGPAGSVSVTARDIVVDGADPFSREPSSINARAGFSSAGLTGNVTITGTRSVTVTNRGELSIVNDAQFGDGVGRPSLLAVTAPVIEVSAGGTITAAATGDMPASNLQLYVGERLDMNRGSITTSAVEGNGGSITVTGPGAVVLRDSQITTSVTGVVGNGGDITIATRGLVLDTGFIQANTAAQQAAGGNVRIETEYLIPSGNTLFVGGSQSLDFRPGIFGLNVIQAAAPTGVSGAITITTPALDVSAGLTPINARVLDGGGLGRGLCDVSGGSSLSSSGRGGMPPTARGFLRDEDEAAMAALARALPVSSRLACRN